MSKLTRERIIEAYCQEDWRGDEIIELAECRASRRLFQEVALGLFIPSPRQVACLAWDFPDTDTHHTADAIFRLTMRRAIRLYRLFGVDHFVRFQNHACMQALKTASRVRQGSGGFTPALDPGVYCMVPFNEDDWPCAMVVGTPNTLRLPFYNFAVWPASPQEFCAGDHECLLDGYACATDRSSRLQWAVWALEGLKRKLTKGMKRTLYDITLDPVV